MTKDFESAYLGKRDSLYRFVFGMVGNKEDALDILQDVYVRIDSKSEIIAPGKLDSYLFITARNLCYDVLKKRNRLLSFEATSDHELFIDYQELDNKSEIEILMQFLERLSPVQRSVIILKDIDGYSYEEVEKILEMDKNNIRVNLSHARKKIRNYFLKLRELEMIEKK